MHRLGLGSRFVKRLAREIWPFKKEYYKGNITSENLNLTLKYFFHSFQWLCTNLES